MDRAWGSFWAIVDMPIFQTKRHTILRFVDQTREEIDWSELTWAAAGWSHGEQILLRVARTLFNETDAVPINELAVLDPGNARRVLQIVWQHYWD